ncbi:MAG: helix-turn-helix domain-containing protein [Candidatus Eremiobacteraeota bacterium]|nr:helix-turn-helix domain-containing protein [Candidatus Eremiobacteraeota bacterium]
MTNPLNKVIYNLESRLERAEDVDQALRLTDRILEAYSRLPERQKLWGLEETAEYLGLKPDTIRKFCSQQKIPHIKLGSRCRFEPGRIKKWVISREIKAHRAWR